MVVVVLVVVVVKGWALVLGWVLVVVMAGVVLLPGGGGHGGVLLLLALALEGDLAPGTEPRWRSWEEGYDPSSWLDRVVQATRVAAFPYHGLDPSAW